MKYSPEIDDHEAVIAGLDQLRRDIAEGRYGQQDADSAQTRHRTQLYLTDIEARSWSAVEVVCTLTVGKMVPRALCMRLALQHLMATCEKTMKDPVAKEKLKAELLAVRNDRRKEPV